MTTREAFRDKRFWVLALQRLPAASPAYLAANGRPGSPEDLGAHRMLVYNLANDPYSLHLKRRREVRAIGITATLDANEGQVIRAAALAGLGILIQPRYIVYDDIVAGRLIPVLPDWELPPLTINLAYQSRRHQPAKIKVFTDFLAERFTQLELERKWRRPTPALDEGRMISPGTPPKKSRALT